MWIEKFIVNVYIGYTHYQIILLILDADPCILICMANLFLLFDCHQTF